MGWEIILVKFLAEVGITAGPSLGKFVGEAVKAFIDDIREGLYTPDLVEYSYLIAAGVIASNPTMTLTLQYELVEEGIRLLTLNPNVKRPPAAISVKALTALSLLRAGFKGEIPG